ncbi:hypothetical protein HRbin26_00211 [bacterium HR26]|nr:hypothetical protein HRbin26_00211 [bacterium HR26]
MVRPLLWPLAICVLLLLALLVVAEASCCPPSLPGLQQRSVWPAARGPGGELGGIDDGASLAASQVSNPTAPSSQHRAWKYGPDVLWARRLLDRMLDWTRQRVLSVEIIWHRVQAGQPESEGASPTGRTIPLVGSFFGSPVHLPVVSVRGGEPDSATRLRTNASSRVERSAPGATSTRNMSGRRELALLLLMLGTPWLLLVLVNAVACLRMRQRFAQLSSWFSSGEHWRWGGTRFQFAPETPLGRWDGGHQRRQRDYTARVIRERESTARLLETIQTLAEAMDASRQTNNWRLQLGEPPLGRAARPAPRHRSAAHTAQALTVPAIPVKRDGTTPGWGKPGARVREGRTRSRRRTVKVLWTREAA